MGEREIHLISKNKKAYHDYTIERKIEAGVVLKGSEVKALRQHKPSLGDSYAMVRNGEAWLLHFAVPILQWASYQNHNEKRDKKLLLHKKQVLELEKDAARKGYTLIALEIYFNERQCVKILLGVAKGKANFDKRHALKEQENNRDMQRELQRLNKRS